MPLDDSTFAEYSSKARINLTFHEPSQVLDFALSGNERVFKQLSMGCFVISDPCATFKYYFKEGEHLIVARSGEEIVEKAQYYLSNPKLSNKIAKNGQRHVLAEHTYRKRAERVLSVLKESQNLINKYK